MTFTAVCSENDVPQGSAARFKAADKAIALYHLSDGYYATAVQCPHTFAPLHRGKIVEDCAIVCPLHRAEFDIRTGEVKRWANFPPGIAQFINLFRKQKALTTYPTKVEDGQVMVDI